MKKLLVLLVILLMGCAPMRPITMPEPKLMPGKTFCNNEICEDTQIYRIVDMGNGDYQDQITVSQVDCGRKTYKIVDAYDHRFMRNRGDEIMPRRFNNSEMLIQPGTYIGGIAAQNCKAR